MDLNSALIFVRVIQSGSFSGAARNLKMPVSTVSTKISQLERDLGTSLLVRTTRKLQLTEAGHRFFKHAVNACSELQAAEAAMSENQEEVGGLIRLTAPIEMGSTSLVDAVADFLKAHPAIQIELVLTDRLVDLVAEGVDLAVRVGHLDDSSLVGKKIGSTELQLYASPAYLKKHGEPKRVQELKKHQCLNFQGSVSEVWEINVGGKLTQVAVQGPLAANNLLALHRMTVHGLGIAILPRFLCADDQAQGRLKHILRECNAEHYPVHLVYPQQKYLPKRVRVLMDFFIANLRELF